MKKIFALLLSILLVGGMLAGCGTDSNHGSKDGKSTNESNKAAFPITVKDAENKEITIKQEPKRIVSLIPSNTEVAFALGLGDKIVGVSDFDNYPKEAAKKEKIGGMEFNVEKIIGLKPDLVLAHESTAKSASAGLQQLRDAGITVVVINDGKNFNDVYESIEMIGRATGTDKKAKSIVQDMKDKIADIQKKASAIPEKDEKSVFVEVSPQPEIYTAGKDTYLDEILSIIHAKNAAKSQDGWAKMSEESIVGLKPDVIITTYGYYVKNPKEQVLGRSGWADVPAVKNKEVYDVNSDMVTRSGPRLVEGIEQIAKVVYPDIFAK
ncbi:ABC transporter substrate-binding protein [Falsibacillus albus]|uniref:ABC transporter substrate-binding protein n=1 Tax=Falsibacillus albus TaxID=2478915 RepID=A0A3L7JZB5_9BACI|nr:ABC transporter substrate-binding protein [Falsibacillus albus]RLQ96218.1 ABC transporter substrate-binding protein [Falsibacillus albus]